jgi:YbgC/YbaW family acyl-CoA thioester hydrolase
MVYLWNDTIEFEDVDSYGIAHHSKLICCLERARVHFFADAGVNMHDGSFQLVLVDMSLKFRSPVQLMEAVSVELRVNVLKAASLIWGYRLLKTSGEVAMEGEVKMASVGPELRPVRFPASVRCVLETIVS